MSLINQNKLSVAKRRANDVYMASLAVHTTTCHLAAWPALHPTGCSADLREYPL